MKHRHKAASAPRTLPYAGPVAKRQNRAAHGNVTVVDSCACGARRLTNVNQQHVERGSWILASMK